MKPDKEIKEFWEKCGFKCINDNKEIFRIVIYPDGKRHCKLPPRDLNNLFKYAVPVILGRHSILETYSFKQEHGLYYSETGIWDRDESQLKGEQISKAFVQGLNLEEANILSLFRAIQQVFKEENDQ